MAVYKRNYQRYDGPLTDTPWRFAILLRYALKEVFDSRLFTAFYSISFGPTLGAFVIIYLTHSTAALAALGLPPVSVIDVNNNFFMTILDIQTTLAFFMAAFLGPNLVTPDLANNALSFYLSRPLTRTEYVLGKLSVLLGLTSLITWIPALFLYSFQAVLEGGSWLWDNLRIGAAIFLVSWIWILTISLLALALAALTRNRAFGGIFMFVVFFAAAGFGNTANAILWPDSDSKWGSLIDLRSVHQTISKWLFDVPYVSDVPVWSAWLALGVLCGISMMVLARKIRAVEVVRG
ncbi:MAG TPA: ABC transporter permease subunit [Terriglobia bacterium]|nr:ABC transporter permease subunit [Terriglobia bacterium]